MELHHLARRAGNGVANLGVGGAAAASILRTKTINTTVSTFQPLWPDRMAPVRPNELGTIAL